ncbi:hypothetical protein H5410_064590 [Solanum commersonii]|uniref:Uncharacterized protein n=1 Tax=Solanum commersonii TaxID=4109 RepID=A0A9J5VZ19_SOLCO|nr:hypothetical protein H5410_064590 [Solanum commersonii]
MQSTACVPCYCFPMKSPCSRHVSPFGLDGVESLLSLTAIIIFCKLGGRLVIARRRCVHVRTMLLLSGLGGGQKKHNL